MSDVVLIEGDTVIFEPSFGAAIVTVKPGQLKGSGPATIRGKRICVSGDEGKVSVRGCTYTTPQFTIPGAGTLSIDRLAGNQTARVGRTGGKSLLLKGGAFTAKFQVDVKAMQTLPNGSMVQDLMSQFQGRGRFVSKNTRIRSA